MNILVTGSSGFIGSKAVEYFISRSHKVWGLSRSNEKQLRTTHYQFIRADLSKEIPFLPRIDVCIHAAAESPVTGKNKKDFYNNNVVATQNLLEGLNRSGCEHLIFTSAVSAYGDIKHATISEVTEVQPNSVYGMTKLLAEQHIRERGNFKVTVLRLPGVLGDGASSIWVIRLIQAAIKNKKLYIYNPNAPFNNAVDIGSLVKFFHALAIGYQDNSHELYLLASSGQLTISQIVEKIIAETNSSSTVEFIEGRNSFTLDCRKATKNGYDPPLLSTIIENQINIELNRPI